ncbi:MAG: DUF551 domain-containing protein [Bacteroidales bacterium]|nr:DUF551 domain-containing protein [Bacteroidales bacterium]
MTREEQIREAATIASKKFRYRDMHFPAISGFTEGAKWADENPKSPWISVEERLPEPEKEVIILDKRKHTDIDFLTDDGEGGYYWWKSDETIWCDDDEITHWMPIPKLQEE